MLYEGTDLTAARLSDLLKDPEKAADYINENCPKLLELFIRDRLAQDAAYSDFLKFWGEYIEEEEIESSEQLGEESYTKAKEKYLSIYDLEKPLPDYYITETEMEQLINGADPYGIEEAYCQFYTEYANNYAPLNKDSMEEAGQKEDVFRDADSFPEGGVSRRFESESEDEFGTYWWYEISNKITYEDGNNNIDSLQLEYIRRDGRYYWYDINGVIGSFGG